MISNYRFNKIYKSHVSICYWTCSALMEKGACYKQLFYGLPSLNCMEISPLPNNCNLRCLHCWRNTENFSKTVLQPSLLKVDNWLDRLIDLRKQLLCGYLTNNKANEELVRLAFNPKFITISLSGEPTLYQHLNEFIKNIFDSGLAMILVTNGTNPDVLLNLKILPDILYVSLHGYDQGSFGRHARPLHHYNYWNQFLKTLSILKKLPTRKIARITVYNFYDMGVAKIYSDLINSSDFDYIELKGYDHIGFSTKNMKKECVPSFELVESLSKVLVKETGFLYSANHLRSRAILLSKSQKMADQRFIQRVK